MQFRYGFNHAVFDVFLMSALGPNRRRVCPH